jgi:hypothetical protein
MDSSVSPTHGEQEMSVWNGHYACTCYHPLFVFNQFGDLELCALRAGNVHSADGWDDVLKPVVARYQGKVSRIHFRADAAFAMPEVYEFLEAERIKYAIRLPANQVLQSRIGYLLTRPVGRPPHHVRRSHANFSYQAGTWTKPRRVIAKVEWHPGELYPRVGFIVTNMSRRPSASLLSTTSGVRAMDQGGQGRGQVDATVVPNVRRQSGAAPASCARLQSRQFSAHAGNAGADQGLVADESEGKADQDWREGSEPGRYVIFQMVEVAIARQMFQEIFVAHRGATAAATTSARDVRCHAFKSNRQKECVQMPGKMAGSDRRPSIRLPEVLVAVSTSRLSCKEGQENANIDAGLGFIWRMSVQVKRSYEYLSNSLRVESTRCNPWWSDSLLCTLQGDSSR